MADPITGIAALSLIVNVFQCAEYACKLLDKGFEVHSSATGQTAKNGSLKDCTDELLSRNHRLQDALAQAEKESPNDTDADDLALRRLAKECEKEAKALLECLASVRGVQNGSKMQSLRAAFKAAGKKNEIDAIASRMRNLREEMDSNTIQSTSLRLRIMSLEHGQSLNRVESNIVENMKRVQQVYVLQAGSQTELLTKILEGQDGLRDLMQPYLRITGPSPSPSRSPSPSLSPSGRIPDVDFVDNIHQLVEAGDKDAVQTLLHDDAEILLRKDKRGRTPLHIAAEHGHDEILKVFIRRGANVNSEDHFLSTPLHYAVKARSVKCARHLLLNGADPKIEDEDAAVPALYTPSNTELAWILQHGAGLNVKNPEQDTALIHFAKRGNATVVRSLLQQGVDMEARGSDGTALVQATIEGQDEIVDLLLNANANINARSAHGSTSLTKAAQLGYTMIAQKLLKRPGIDLNARNSFSFSALAEASHHNFDTIAVLLIRAGADVELLDGAGFGPIHRAAQSGSLRLIRELLTREPSLVNWRGHDRWAPLSEASFHGHAAAVETLLELGASVEIRNGNAYTPLHLAAERGHSTVVKILLEKGKANIEAEGGPTGAPPCGHGWTPLIYAIRHATDAATVKELLDHGADANHAEYTGSLWPPLFHAVHMGGPKGIKIVEMLIEQGKADINYRPGGVGPTALWEAIQTDNTDMVQTLLRLGADPGIIDCDPNISHGKHYPPICWAAIKSPKCMRVLVETCKLMQLKSFNIDAQNKDGWTALHEMVFYDNVSGVKFLLEQGADRNIQAKSGRTPLAMCLGSGGTKKYNWMDVKALLTDIR